MLKSMRLLDKQSDTINPSKQFVPLPPTVHKGTSAIIDFIKKQREAAEGAKQVKSAWGGIGGLIRSAIAAFGVKQLLGLSDNVTSIDVRLNLMNDGSQSTDDLSAKIMASAQRSRASYLDTASAIAKLGLNASAAFKSNNETIAFMEQVNKLFVIGGASTQEQANAMTQLTQAMAAGALRGEELNSILDAGPGIARAIEKYMGISEGSIKSMAEQGLVTADVVKNALFSAAEDTNAKFNSMPKTYAQVWTQIKNSALRAFDSILGRVNAFVNSETGTEIINGALAGINLIAAGVSWLFDVVTMVGDGIRSKWTTIQPILETALPLAIMFASILLVAMFAQWVAGAASAAIATIAASWPLLLIAGLIVGIIALAMKMGASFGDVCGFIAQTVGGLFALSWNLVADIWNLIATFGEFFGNFMNDPVGSIIRLMYGLQDIVLGILETIANAIDAIFGSNLAGTINDFRASVNKNLDAMLGEQSFKIERMEKVDYADTMKQWGAAGRSFGDSMENAADSFGSMFGNSDPFGESITTDGIAAALNGANLGYVGEVGKINGDVNIADEDLKLMKDVAEMRYVQNFVSVTPTVTQTIGTVNQNADVNDMLSEAERIIREEMAADAEGIYS